MPTPPQVSEAMRIRLDDALPPMPAFVPGIRRAPDRGFTLSAGQTVTALQNALRYVPEHLHERLAPEFLEELKTRGRIYGYRFRPEGAVKAKPVDAYQGRCLAGRAFQVMIDNNLDFDVALYPYELVTYGETGSVCQNWMQYRLIRKYLEALTENQTLVVASGHPLGLFPAFESGPRVIITNGPMIGMYDRPEIWETGAQMGVTNYGQMTAGGWMYIGPQGIVHGTYNTLLNAGRIRYDLARGRGPEGDAVHHLGIGGHERRPAQGRRHRRGRFHHRGGGRFAHRDPPRPGVGAEGLHRPGRGFRLGPGGRGEARPPVHRLSRQRGGPAGRGRGPGSDTGTALRPDVLPRGLHRRVLPPGDHLRGAHPPAVHGPQTLSGVGEPQPAAPL